MNVFVLDQNPFKAAEYHCDKHVVKMILEYAQLMCTAHRVLDGRLVTMKVEFNDKKKTKRAWLFEGERLTFNQETGKFVISGQVGYKATHVNHPCAIWARTTDANYSWLNQLWDGCLREYTRRYGKKHKAAKLEDLLRFAPRGITSGLLTEFPQAMPDEFKHEDVVEAYRRFYRGPKSRFAKWKDGNTPSWF